MAQLPHHPKRPRSSRRAPAPLQYAPRTDLSPWEKVVETEVAEYFAANRKLLIREYRKKFGHIIDRNNAQELYRPYARNRESRQKLSLATHEPAGALADEIYQHMVKLKCTEARNIVLFNAGGQGSGKTTSLRFSGKADRAFIVMDGTMQDYEKSCRNIDLALSNGKLVHINYVFCPFPKAIQNIIRRATDVANGRVVNVNRAAKGHFQALENIFKIEKAYRNNPSVTFGVIDNSGDKPKTSSLRELRFLRYPSVDALKQRGYSAVDAYFKSSQAGDPSLTGKLHQLLKGKSV
jgi:hypothetical protein